MPFLAGITLILVLLSASCQFNFGTPPNPSNQVPGYFVIISQHCYGDATDFSALINADADYVLNNIGNGWRNVAYVHDTPVDLLADECTNGNYNEVGDPAVATTDFTNSTASGADFIWFSGHGYRNGTVPLGVLALYNFQPGMNCDVTPYICFWTLDRNLPYKQNTKWVFTVSSFGVTNQSDPWLGAFNPNGNGLHGFYGFEGEPTDLAGEQLAKQFLDDAYGSLFHPNPMTVHQSWIDAARANGHGSEYGIFELGSASNDQLSGTPSGFNVPVTSNGQWSVSNPVVFYDASGSWAYGPGPTPLSTQSPGSYRPIGLVPEHWSDTYLSGQADTYEPGALKYYESSNQFRVISKSYTGSHYESSGALIVETNMSTRPFNFTVQDALNYALTQLQQSGGGLPADAVLHQTITHYRHDSSGSVVLAYEFVWVHNDGRLGGDRIDIAVDNTSTDKCVDWEVDNCGHKHCTQTQTFYYMRIDYMYRLWRGLGRYLQSTGSPPPALSPAQAFALATNQPMLKGSKTSLGALVGYTYSYWAPPFDSLDNAAYPAFHFYYANHQVVSVDALSGTVLGATSSY